MQIIQNTRLVTANECFTGTLVFGEGHIVDLSQGSTALSECEDWDGDFLIPGMVEVHSTNLENHLLQSSVACDPMLPAIVGHDAQIASAGITTILNAIALGDCNARSWMSESLDTLMRALHLADQAGILRADHLMHLSLELASENLMPVFASIVHDSSVKLVSMTDLTQAQQQWRDLLHERQRADDARTWRDEKVDSMLATLQQVQPQLADGNRQDVLNELAHRSWPIPLASRADTTIEDVTQGVRDGVSISQFPTTLDAARSAREHGMGIVGRTTNLRSGKAAARDASISSSELARANLLDVLSSEQRPHSLLHAAFGLQKDGLALHDAIATVTRNPALMLGLVDRGELAPELRADFLRVRVVDEVPVVLETWKAGIRVA